MKRILIRAGISPLDNPDPSQTILGNTIGNNNGNLLYAYSVFRTLMVNEDYCVDADYYKCESRKLSDKEVDSISEKYDLYVLPLANAFRYSYRNALANLTSFIERVKIPVVLLGVGLSVENETDFSQGLPHEEIIRKFVTALLGKSACVGTRGEITRDYLVSLGFRPEKDITAIGCPSAYTFGLDIIPLCRPKTGFFSKILLNDSLSGPENVHEFIYNLSKKHKNSCFLPQTLQELKGMYLGAPLPQKEGTCYPVSVAHPFFTSGRARFFINMPSWFGFVKDASISVGSRMHGNVVPTLMGVPSLFLSLDTRMDELIAYHHYASVKAGDINKNDSLNKLTENVDFSGFEKHHKENFEHYISYLNNNGVQTIYDDNPSCKRGECFFDKKISGISFFEGVSPIVSCDKEEMMKRWNEYYPQEEAYIKKLRKSKKK